MSSIIQHSINYELDLLKLHELNPQRYPFLLESVATGPQGRFDILFALPQDAISLFTSDLKETNFLKQLDEAFLKDKVQQDLPEEIPFAGGWFVYLAYELAQQIEPVLQLPKSERDFPVALMVRIPAAFIRDRQSKKAVLVLEQEFSKNAPSLIEDAEVASNLDSSSGSSLVAHKILEEDSQRYHQSLERIHKYILEGDVFQVNLSRQWRADLNEPRQAYDIYRRLRQTNPAPFAGLMCWQGQSVISSSPERLVSTRGRCIETRPIAGTRPREANDQDELKRNELIQHPKERAEHVMLIDLERNDLGRVCVPGSVEVNELMTLESYAHVHHIVSNVRGELREDVTPGEAIAAVFPGGTITGCPKVRCMEIIAELEGEARDAYTGSFGYLNRNGDMDLNILIRTIMQKDKALVFRAGAGIVVDSDSETELEETRAKAKGMLKVFHGDLG